MTRGFKSNNSKDLGVIRNYFWKSPNVNSKVINSVCHVFYATKGITYFRKHEGQVFIWHLKGDIMKHYFACLLLALVITGCAPSRHQLTVDGYMAAAPKVRLDMTKEEVIEILQPSQHRLKNTEIKHSDMYKKEGVLVEILYFRSGWQSDGITTDDEFTPYLFNDGKLVAVGWAILGGPKSQGQATPETSVYTTTIVRPIAIIH